MAKARTKARKLQAKRGRPRMEDVAREPNGRPSRSGIAHEAIDKLALDARRRMLGLKRDEAKDQKAGSFIGYLSMIGPRDGISHAQYEGAQQYLRLRESYKRAVKSPDALYDDMATLSTGDEEAYEAWAKSITSERDSLHQQIQEAQNSSRENLWAALQLVILDDQKLHHLIGATRVLCNVFVRHFRIGAQNGRAA